MPWAGRRGQRIGAEAVIAARSGKAEENDQNDGAEERNEKQQKPPTAAVGVVKAAYGYREVRYEGCEPRQGRERSPVIGDQNADRLIDDCGGSASQRREQNPEPKFRTRGATGKGRVFGEDRPDRLPEIHAGRLSVRSHQPREAIRSKAVRALGAA